MNIVEIVVGSDDFDILETALTTANLVTTIQDSPLLTVFAPNDAAFTQLAVDLGYEGDPDDEDAVFGFIAGALEDLDPNRSAVEVLTDVLTYHVEDQPFSREEVTDTLSEIPTLLSDTNAAAVITPNGRVLGDLEPDLLNPTIISDQIDADNGVIHVIDRVLLPIDIPGNHAPSLFDIASAGGTIPDDNNEDTDILAAALDLAGLTDTIETAPSLTVLAPTDGAFISLAQQLGFQGSDETGALTFIVGALTALGGGDPIPLLTAILTYHVVPGQQQSANLTDQGVVTTLQGGTFQVAGTTLIDNEPDLLDPTIIAPDIQAGNGIVHVIDQVLIPVDIPATDGSNDVQVLMAGPVGARLYGGIDNDLLIDGAGGDILFGGAGADTYVLSDDGVRDKIVGFEDGIDTVDISAWGVSSVDDLVLKQRTPTSVIVGHGDNDVVLQAGAALSVDDIGADSFVFATGTQGEIIQGTDGRDVLEGTKGADLFDGGLGRDVYIGGGGADVFFAGTDTYDIIKDYTENRDQIDISAWGISGFDELTITDLDPARGRLLIEGGIGQIRLQAADGEITATDLDFFDFVFN